MAAAIQKCLSHSVQFVKDHKLAILVTISAVALGVLLAQPFATTTCESKYGTFIYKGLSGFEATVDDQMFKDGFTFINHPPFSKCATIFSLGNWSFNKWF